MTGAGRTSVDVLLAVGYDPDPRVRRLTQVLAQDGFDIRVLAWDRDGTRRPREQLPVLPSERLITRAGLAFAGTPETLPPEAQTMASAMSEV